jgi:hypothetical protein
MSTNTYLFGALFLLTAISFFFLIRMEVRMRRLFRGKSGSDLESVMREITETLHVLDSAREGQEKTIHTLEERLSTQGRGVRLLRFNPFKDVGGNQSFAVGIVNEHGDGVVFSSLYSRERMSVFAKPITNGTSDIELTEEERSVVEDAHKDAQA